MKMSIYFLPFLSVISIFHITTSFFFHQFYILASKSSVVSIQTFESLLVCSSSLLFWSFESQAEEKGTLII